MVLAKKHKTLRSKLIVTQTDKAWFRQTDRAYSRLTTHTGQTSGSVNRQHFDKPGQTLRQQFRERGLLLYRTYRFFLSHDCKYLLHQPINGWPHWPGLVDLASLTVYLTCTYPVTHFSPKCTQCIIASLINRALGFPWHVEFHAAPRNLVCCRIHHMPWKYVETALGCENDWCYCSVER